jgi:hypothetical protein
VDNAVAKSGPVLLFVLFALLCGITELVVSALVVRNASFEKPE